MTDLPDQSEDLKAVPEPRDTGSAGTQLAGTGEVIANTASSALEGLPITHAITGLAATHSRNMGGEMVAGLVAGCFNQLSHDFQETKQDLRRTREHLDATQRELADSNREVAVLRTKIEGASTARRLRDVILMLGTALVSFGIELFRGDLTKQAYIVGGIGTILLLLAWFSRSGGAKR